MEISSQFELVANYGVALEQLRNGKIDGFFLATQNRYRDRVAKKSDSVLITNWSWFYIKTSYSCHYRNYRSYVPGDVGIGNCYVWRL